MGEPLSMMRTSLVFGVCAALVTPGIGQAQTAKLLQPINLGNVNTSHDEDDPHAAASGLTLYYATRTEMGSRIFVSTRKAITVPWNAGKAHADLQAQGDNVHGVFLTTDRTYPQYLYYTVNKNPEKAAKRGGNFDVFFLIKQSAKADFTSPTPAQAVCTEADERHPWLTANGQHLYFSRRAKEGWQVFVSSRPAGGGNWGEPRRVELPIDFHHATLAPNGKTMYLQGPIGAGRWGLFRAEVKSLTTCGEPQPLVDFNHPEGKIGTISPNLSRDGMRLYFASDRPGGKGGLDLWTIPTAQVRQ